MQATLDTLYGKGAKDAAAEFRQYQAKPDNANASYEELRLRELERNKRTLNTKIDTQIDALNAEAKELKQYTKTFTGKKRAHVGYVEARIKLDNIYSEIDALNKQKERAGLANRMYRHEVAKNEVAGMSWGRNFSRKRLAKAGYSYEGLYKWGDVQRYISPNAARAWAADLNKFTGGKLGQFNPLRDNTRIHVLRNTHRGDRRLATQLGKRYDRIGTEISHKLATGKIRNMKELRSFLTNYITKHSKEFSKDQLTAIRSLGGDTRAGNLKPKFRISPRDISEGKTLNKFVENIAQEVKKSGGFRGNRGVFTLGQAGGVSSLYLEGGVNESIEFVPKIDTKSGKHLIHKRVIKTDFQDLFHSGKVGIQETPFIIDEHVYREDVASGKKYYNMTKDSPFPKGREMEMRQYKQTPESNLRKTLSSKQSINEKRKQVLQIARGNKKARSIALKKTARYLARRSGVYGGAALIGAGILGAILNEKK